MNVLNLKFCLTLRVGLNNCILFRNMCYCGIDKIAVILHPIKFGSFESLRTA